MKASPVSLAFGFFLVAGLPLATTASPTLQENLRR